jgi:hypothetical protein
MIPFGPEWEEPVLRRSSASRGKDAQFDQRTGEGEAAGRRRLGGRRYGRADAAASGVEEEAG